MEKEKKRKSEREKERKKIEKENGKKKRKEERERESGVRSAKEKGWKRRMGSGVGNRVFGTEKRFWELGFRVLGGF